MEPRHRALLRAPGGKASAPARAGRRGHDGPELRLEPVGQKRLPHDSDLPLGDEGIVGVLQLATPAGAVVRAGCGNAPVRGLDDPHIPQRLPVEHARDPLRLITRIDDECPTGCVRVSNEKAVRLEGADRQSANFEPAGIAGVQTENEVPQPQDQAA